jgi:tetratricopeptide (TPR) repeat protein
MLTVGPLGPQFGEAIITEILKESPRPTTSELIQRLLSVGEGNPFFLRELGNHWLETGRQRGSPPSVTAIIDERLARLSNEALLVLQACAVLDVNATIERVEGVLEYHSHVLLSAVQELSVAGMLRAEAQTSPESAEPLTVGHDLVSTAALKRLAMAPLAFLHRRAGTVLERETLGDGSRTAVLWACAFHWQSAGDRERAFRAACSCAEHLLTVGMPRDAAPAFERVLGYCVTDEQRLLVLSRLASSLQVCGLWEESKGVLHKSRQLQAKIAPNANTHDDVEFALFEARWRASRWRANLGRSSLLDELKACAGTSDASLSHRVGCGLLGLKIAAGENQIDAMEELYLTMVPLLESPKIAATTRLEVEVIYHSTCGDVRRAERAADQLLVVAGDEADPRIRARALLNVGTAYRLAGRMNDAETVLLELVGYSVSHGYLNRASFAFLALARVYLAAGDLPRTRAALQKLEALTDGEQDHLLTGDRFYMFARLALDEGNVEEAAEKYADLAAQTGINESVNWQAAALALGIRIGIAQHASTEMLAGMVAALEVVHLQNRGWGSQDFEAHALALGLHYCGALEKSRLLFADYVTTYRREKWALPQYLRDLLRELQGSYVAPVTRTMEPLSGIV